MTSNRDTLFRQWSMLRKIPRHPRWITTRQMTAHLEDEDFAVTARTVERDLAKLSTLFGYTCDEAGPGYRWYWPTGFRPIEIPSLEPSTALAFNLAERHLQPLLPPSTLDLLTPYFERARAVLDDLPHKPLSHWRDKVHVIGIGPELASAPIDPAIQRTVYAALLEEKRVRVTYEPRGQDHTRDYEFSPLALVSRQGVLYLVGPLWSYENVVQLALHRIQSAEILDATIHQPADFEIEAYIREAGEFSYPTGSGTIKLELALDEATAVHLAERPLSTDQHITEHSDARVRLTATVLDTEELTWWLLGFGAAIEVIGPASLRQRIVQALDAAATQYAMG
ncbi:helix-turn-helix transcriptional regulator [Salinisphaera hydrothermalis]|uniref:helix-turn-helix transcriptional regulator n=1 Tax=Salinisphaera hydrothermalis TaxID=563188 RepID=UPI0033426B5F